jgi:hypothetical protein
VTRRGKGWACRVARPGQFHGWVTFDAAGKCLAVSKVDDRPLPK